MNKIQKVSLSWVDLYPIYRLKGDYDRNKKYNVISLTFFRSVGKSDKDFEKYKNGLKRWLEIVKKYYNSEIKLRVFFDDSILKNKELAEWFFKLNQNPEIQPVYVYCKGAKEKIGHESTFLTMLRFIPMMNYGENDTNTVFIKDLDINPKEEPNLVELNKNFIKDKTIINLTILIAYYMLETIPINFIPDEYKNNLKEFNPEVKMTMMIMPGVSTKYKFKHEILDNFMNQVLSQNFKDNKLKDIIERQKKEKFYSHRNIRGRFFYTIDEIFLNLYLSPILVNPKFTQLIISIPKIEYINQYFDLKKIKKENSLKETYIKLLKEDPIKYHKILNRMYYHLINPKNYLIKDDLKDGFI